MKEIKIILSVFALCITAFIIFLITLELSNPARTTREEKKEAQRVAALLAITEWVTEDSTVVRFNSDGTAAIDIATGNPYMEREEDSYKVWRRMGKVVSENGETVEFRPYGFMTIALLDDGTTLEVTTMDGFQWNVLGVERWRRGDGSVVSLTEE